MSKETGKRSIPKSTPRDVFSYLLMIAMLYVSVGSFLGLIFSYIDFLIPDALVNFGTYNYSGIRNASSILFVTFPVYIAMSWLIGRDIKKEHNKKDIRVRRWLIYLTLFIAAITIIVDLITLVNGFYDGDLTTAFVLKALSVLLLAAAIFGFYLWDLHIKKVGDKKPRIFAWITSAIVLIVLVSGFFIVGSPKEQRAIRFDDDRISDLSSIQYQLINYLEKTEELPKTLDALNNDATGFRVPVDPETGNEYGYSALNNYNFELCATFNTEVTDSFDRRPVAPPRGVQMKPYGEQDIWNHPAGNHCFVRELNPDLLNFDKDR